MLCSVFIFHYYFSLCLYLDNFYWPIHWFLYSFSCELVNRKLYFHDYILILAPNLILFHSFYLSVEIPHMFMHFFSTFSTWFYNILIILILNPRFIVLISGSYLSLALLAILPLDSVFVYLLVWFSWLSCVR